MPQQRRFARGPCLRRLTRVVRHHQAGAAGRLAARRLAAAQDLAPGQAGAVPQLPHLAAPRGTLGGSDACGSARGSGRGRPAAAPARHATRASPPGSAHPSRAVMHAQPAHRRVPPISKPAQIAPAPRPQPPQPTGACPSISKAAGLFCQAWLCSGYMARFSSLSRPWAAGGSKVKTGAPGRSTRAWCLESGALATTPRLEAVGAGPAQLRAAPLSAIPGPHVRRPRRALDAPGRGGAQPRAARRSFPPAFQRRPEPPHSLCALPRCSPPGRSRGRPRAARAAWPPAPPARPTQSRPSAPRA